jgi:transcriptional regulator with XRE-family HTH domain
MNIRRVRFNRLAVRRLRRQHGLSLEELGARVGTTKQNLALIEQGYSEPRARTIAKLAMALEVGPEEFFIETETAGAAPR